ncbi:MAG: hypothetical protein GX175_08740 [Halanaerobiaceae bacterium]|jgi:bacteriocin-like protein|nr:hypothetical protein [Halanaerobiaceae bacterium]
MECFANVSQMGICELNEQELMAINGGETFKEWADNAINAIGEAAKNAGKAAGKAARQVYEAAKDIVKDIYDTVTDFVGNLANSF